MISDAEKLMEMLADYKTALKHNTSNNEDAKSDDYFEATASDFHNYSKEVAEYIDALSIPFDVRVKDRAFVMALELHQSKKDNGCYTFKGQDREYYERVRNSINEQIAQTQDTLEAAKLIEDFGRYLNEATEFFKIAEAVEMLRQGDIWGKEMKSAGSSKKRVADTGGTQMNEALEAYGDKRELEAKAEVVINIIASGKLTLEEIAEISGFSLEKVEELAGRNMDVQS